MPQKWSCRLASKISKNRNAWRKGKRLSDPRLLNSKAKSKYVMQIAVSKISELIGLLIQQALDLKLKETLTPVRKLQEELQSLQAEFGQAEANINQELQGYNKSTEQLGVKGQEILRYLSLLATIWERY